MNKVHITDDCNDKRLVGASGESLDDTRSKEVLVRAASLADGCPDDVKKGGGQEARTLSKFPAQCAPDRSRGTSSKEIITGDENDLIKTVTDILGNDDIHGVEERTVSSGVEYGTE